MFTVTFLAMFFEPVDMKMKAKSSGLEHQGEGMAEGMSLQMRWKIPVAWGKILQMCTDRDWQGKHQAGKEKDMNYHMEMSFAVVLFVHFYRRLINVGQRRD